VILHPRTFTALYERVETKLSTSDSGIGTHDHLIIMNQRNSSGTVADLFITYLHRSRRSRRRRRRRRQRHLHLIYSIIP